MTSSRKVQHATRLQFPHTMQLLTKLATTQAPRSVVLIRLMIGAVFLSEGIQKFLFPAEVGAGRFEKIGLPSPEFVGHLVGGCEILFGTLVCWAC